MPAAWSNCKAIVLNIMCNDWETSNTNTKVGLHTNILKRPKRQTDLRPHKILGPSLANNITHLIDKCDNPLWFDNSYLLTLQ